MPSTFYSALTLVPEFLQPLYNLLMFTYPGLDSGQEPKLNLQICPLLGILFPGCYVSLTLVAGKDAITEPPGAGGSPHNLKAIWGGARFLLQIFHEPGDS